MHKKKKIMFCWVFTELNESIKNFQIELSSEKY